MDLVVHGSHLVYPFFGGGGGEFVVIIEVYCACGDAVQASVGRVTMGGGRYIVVGKFGKR